MRQVSRRAVTLVVVGVVSFGCAALLVAEGGRAGANPGAVLINSRLAEGPERPRHFGWLSTDNTEGTPINWVREINWTNWGGPTADGVGQVGLLDERTGTSPVNVELGGRQECGGVQVYSNYNLTLQPGAPEPAGWTALRMGSFPCRIAIGNYSGERLGRRSNCVFGLYETSPNPKGGARPARWHPKAPEGKWFLCQLRLKHWGQPVVTGAGMARLGAHLRGRIEWPVSVKISRPIWCPKSGEYGSAITYSRLTITLHGNDLQNAGNARRYIQRIETPKNLARCELGIQESHPWWMPPAAQR
jgi:hypothetical protein